VLFGKRMKQARLDSLQKEGDLTYQSSGQTMIALQWTKNVRAVRDIILEKLGLEFNSCLFNFCRNGIDSMGWHQYNEKSQGVNPMIASETFGSERKFKLKNSSKDIRKTIVLTHGSLMIKCGETQHSYKQALLKTKRNRELFYLLKQYSIKKECM